MSSTVPHIDPGARQRLKLRFGDEMEAWFDNLPDLLTALSADWRFELGSAIPRGSVSAVCRCRMDDERLAVLKVSPDHARLTLEASALREWDNAHTPAVIAFAGELGALLIEAIEPGNALVDSSAYPPMDGIVELLDSLHQTTVPGGTYPALDQRVADLFQSSAKLYERYPGLAALVSRETYERGHQLALQLSGSDGRLVLLHGDLTPSNILDGGDERGLVAIDPAPCIGDPAFDAVDLILWNAIDLGTIDARIERLTLESGLDNTRLVGWCSAFAGMNALEIASQGKLDHSRIEPLLALASKAEPL